MSTDRASTIDASLRKTERVTREWLVAQLGAREHYAVARALARRGRLAQFYTDGWCRWGRSILRQGPGIFRAFANRYHEELASQRVTSFSGRATWNVVRRRFLERFYDPSALTNHHVDVGAWFGKRVRNELVNAQRLLPDRHAFFGFSTGSLEVLSYLDDTGVISVVDQVSPGPIEYEIVSEEVERWPGWALQSPCKAPGLQRRVTAEWDAASLVLVNSEWSRSALLDEGVPEEKLVVVPGAYEPPEGVQTHGGVNSSGPLSVLWLGSVVLRKGIPYLVEAARELEPLNDVEITVAGPIGITERAVAQSPDNMTFVGSVARDRVSTLYADADVFVLPTLSDGFGITQVEAMAHGCPVITTPNCGRVVTDGEDGRVIPPRDSEALAAALRHLTRNRGQLVEMSRIARQTARRYTLDAYAERLFGAIQSVPSDS
mgnify:CR=1 FL=1